LGSRLYGSLSSRFGITGREFDRAKLCEARECGWIFYDSSRSRRRRWCSMAICGNRAKARRHYAQSKEGA
jgi:predicted RNA-binding Zn ribbon-like protein